MFRDKFRKRIALALSTELYIQPWVFFFVACCWEKCHLMVKNWELIQQNIPSVGMGTLGMASGAIFGKLGLKMPIFFEVQGLHLSNG